MRLRDLQRHSPATVSGFCPCDPDLQTRLREIGFAEGDRVESVHYGLFGGNPISVKLNGAHIALRRHEANAVFVEPVSDALAIAAE